MGRALLVITVLVLASGSMFADEPRMKALIIEGQNNHAVWPKTSRMMKKYLEETQRFSVDIMRTADKGTDPSFKPNFQSYQVVVSNYNGAAWPKETQESFIDYVKAGGGFVVVHAANNAFGDWPEYNAMIGLGGWGGRNEKSGPYVYLDAAGKLIRDTTPGRGGNHGSQHPFQVIVRDADHPITKGLPREWIHSNDELYDLLRGPAENMNVLATAFADKAKGGTGRHEPMIFTVTYGKGRVFHTPMGHAQESQECVGFITVFQRGTEWASTGKVTLTIPKNFPTADKVSLRSFSE